MEVAVSRLDKRRVKSIKKAIVRGEALVDLAEEHDVGYMTIYKIATGVTWKKVKPRGRLIGNRDYSDRREVPLKRCEKIATIKIRKKVPNTKIAEKIGVSESTVQRAVAIGRAALAVRLEAAILDGTIRKFKKRTGISDDEAKRLGKVSIPEWVRREIEDDG